MPTDWLTGLLLVLVSISCTLSWWCGATQNVVEHVQPQALLMECNAFAREFGVYCVFALTEVFKKWNGYTSLRQYLDITK
jgi:hypothetical protein